MFVASAPFFKLARHGRSISAVRSFKNFPPRWSGMKQACSPRCTPIFANLPFKVTRRNSACCGRKLRHALKHLSRWAAPVRRRTPWFVAPARGWVQPEPFGVALILGPWNYPVQLLLAPLVSAIAAGNCAVLKPSELAPRTAEAIAALAREAFAENFISVVTGGADVAEALLRERFDKIFFTGSTRVGRAVMTAAAKNLTPVTLELGGKCPAIVCADAVVEQAAKRIAWGKFLNAGQTCVAPDFVLVQRGVGEAFLAALKKSLREFYGEDASKSADYGRIVNARHFARLGNYLRDGKIIHGGEQRRERFVSRADYFDRCVHRKRR